MIYLDRNESYYGPAPACFEVLKKADLTTLSWYTKAHTRGVKSILSERLAEEFNIPENQTVLGYGAEDLLKQVVQCYLTKGSKLMIPSYSWWYYKKMAEEVDGINIEYPMVKGENTFYYDLDSMIEIYDKEKPEMVFISSPNNPTGNSISSENLTSALTKMKDTIVVLDEAYAYNDKNDRSRELIDKFPNLIIIRTFSKYYALAGVRIGYAFLGANLTGMSKFVNRYLGYNRVSEEIAIAALDSPEYYSNVSKKMDEDKDLFKTELNQISGFQVFHSDANFILVEIPDECQSALKEFLLDKGLSIKFMNEELLKHHLRITLGTQEQNRLLIDSIKEFAAVEKMV